ncbi:MAG: glutathione S-transferase family protein [Hyphomicrobiaceae bacterium]
MSAPLTLYIGSKAFSSWSLRPWLALKRAGLDFEEVEIPLRQPGTRAAIDKVSPSGKVPCLVDGGLQIWDSLAICEYAAELAPSSTLWPSERAARAFGRSISAEMHSGLAKLRQTLPMDFAKTLPTPEIGPELEADIARIVAIWRQGRTTYGASGPCLLGAFSIADAMYAPVCSRFTTYGIGLSRFGDDGTAEAYREHMMSLPEMQAWGMAAAKA